MASTALTQTTAAAPFRYDPATHSGKLKYANALDLPSFPSAGLKKNGAAASAAASLGWANTKSPQIWTPGVSVVASAAALLANDSKMPPTGDSRRANTGSQAAAFAVDSAQRHRRTQTSPPSDWGSSAANLAFKNSMSPPPATGSTATLARQGSLHAAKGAMAGSIRPRARSSPVPKESYPDQANAVSNALSAATIAHRPSMMTWTDIPIEEGGSVPYTTMDRQMFTSHPPVKLEVDERRHNDILHASAVAMAKQMYSTQQSVINTNRANAHARSSSFTRHRAGSVADQDEQPVMFTNLQEAAYRLAQERLAKLQDEHQKNQTLQEYYGSPNLPQRNKLGSLRSKLTRRRSASDGALLEDQMRSQRIRKQMPLFDTKLAEVGEQKRTKDREALLAAAQRNVQARLRDMDKKVQEETGWVPPTTKDDWEWKARAAAQARFDASRLEQERKVDIGGGKVMDREAVEAIAAKRVQPLLDEINEKAERERERKALQKAEEEKQKEEAEVNKMKEREIQEIHKKLKEQQRDQEKARKAEIRQEEKARKEDEKAARAEQKRIAKEGKGKEKEVFPAPVEAVAVPESARETTVAEAEPDKTNRHSKALSISFPKLHKKQKSKDFKEKELTAEGEPSTSPTNKVKSWLKTHFPRPRSHSSPTTVAEASESNNKKFIGGATLARLTGRNDSSASFDHRRSTSMQEVALAGWTDNISAADELADSSTTAPDVTNLARVSTPPPVLGCDEDSTSLETMTVSSLSSSDKFEEARTTISDVPVSPPPKFVRAGPETGRASPVRGSRFSEILE